MARDRGAALLMALLLAVLVAVLAGGMMRGEQRRMRLLENQRVRDQTEQMGEGALDWARLILRDDLRVTGAVDHLGEVWALPISDIPLSKVLGEDSFDSRLTGRIIDAQGRFNLMSLVKVRNPQGDRGWVAATEIDTKALEAFQRLLTALGLDPAQASSIAQRVLTSRFDPAPNHQGSGLSGGGASPWNERARLEAPMPLGSVSELSAWFPDADPMTLKRLNDVIVILPRPTTVNANTASATVLGAMLGVDPARLNVVIQGRQQNFFVDMADLQRRLNAALPELPSVSVGLLGVGSDYFFVLEELRRSEAVQRRQALVARHQGVGQETQVIHEQQGWTVGWGQSEGGG